MPYWDAVLPTRRAISPRLAISIDFNGSVFGGDAVLFHLRLRLGDPDAFAARKRRIRDTGAIPRYFPRFSKLETLHTSICSSFRERNKANVVYGVASKAEDRRERMLRKAEKMSGLK